jgi:hypothetical protein
MTRLPSSIARRIAVASQSVRPVMRSERSDGDVVAADDDAEIGRAIVRSRIVRVARRADKEIGSIGEADDDVARVVGDIEDEGVCKVERIGPGGNIGVLRR